jgi:predicted dehydrogenase
MDATKIALAGYGLGARVFHAPIIRATDGLHIASVFSPSAETRARAEADLGVATCATFDELLAGDIELVVIVTPHDTHADLAVRALEAGKHVVVDKVMCLTLGEADRMIATARAAGRILTVYQNRRWDGDFLTVKKLLDEGALGEPVVVEARWVRAALSRRASWRLERARGGGMWLDLGAHMVDQLMLLFGPVASVFCRQHFTEPDLDVPTLTECLLTFRSGVTGVVETGALTPIERPRWLVRGTEACYEKHGFDPQRGACARA